MRLKTIKEIHTTKHTNCKHKSCDLGFKPISPSHTLDIQKAKLDEQQRISSEVRAKYLTGGKREPEKVKREARFKQLMGHNKVIIFPSVDVDPWDNMLRFTILDAQLRSHKDHKKVVSRQKVKPIFVGSPVRPVT